jgi:cytosine/creatinine deaminase
MARLAIVDASLADGSRVDVVLEDGQIAAVAPDAGRSADDKVDAAGGLLLPAYVDTHIHLDKVLIRDQLAEHDGTLRGAIDAIHAAKRAYTVEDVRRRATAVIEASVLTGTTRLRSHVDVDTVGGLVPLDGVLAAARDCADIAEVQVIAFPQEGLLRDPGAADLMAEAMQRGATVVGGMPHWEATEDAQREHVWLCFELAARHDADVDMHVDETDDGSVRTLAMVVAETERRGWQHRVTVGHVCALAAADHDYAERVIADCARLGITVVANPVTNLVIQGRGDRGLVRRGTTRVRELMAAGVPVAFGQDCVQDGFYPFGRGDLLEVALISAHAAHLSTAAELHQALAAVTSVPAAAWHLGDGYGVAAGALADLQLYAATSWPEVLRLQDPPREVWFRGRSVARTTVTRELIRVI